MLMNTEYFIVINSKNKQYIYRMNLEYSFEFMPDLINLGIYSE